MTLKLTFLILSCMPIAIFSQVNSNKVWFAKEYSKEIALYKSKQFLFKNILDSSPEVIQFEISSLAAASSGELTTLLYKCDSKKRKV